MAVHEKSVVVNAPVHDVYGIWRKWEDFPNFMSHVKEVRMLDSDTSHWKAKIWGLEEEWDAKTTVIEEDKIIGWRSISGFENSGEVRFQSLPEGTEITVHIEYDPPVGILGEAAERLYVGREFDDSLEHDLQHFKTKMECKV